MPADASRTAAVGPLTAVAAPGAQAPRTPLAATALALLLVAGAACLRASMRALHPR